MVPVTADARRARRKIRSPPGRAAFHAGAADTVVNLTRIGDLYVDWVEGHASATPAERAEAYRMRSAATAREAMHHALAARQLAELGSSQRIAAEAGYWLAADGRPADAVVAVEHSRAVLLSRLTGGREPQVRRRLAAQGPGTARFVPECPAQAG